MVVAHFLVEDFAQQFWIAALLALSSTAMAAQMLEQNRQVGTPHAEVAIAILLFQDMAAIALIVATPLLVGSALEQNSESLFSPQKLLIFAGWIALSYFLLSKIYSWLASTRQKEVLLATSLLTVLSFASLAHWVGLSASLGAFLAGILLANSNYRHQIEADISPLKGLLLGLFFVSVGIQFDAQPIVERPISFVLLLAAAILIKVGSIFLALRLARLDGIVARNSSLYLGQMSEFGLVLLAMATQLNILSVGLNSILTATILFSFFLSPVLVQISERIFKRFSYLTERPYDVETRSEPVIIAGYGRVGQVMARMLRLRKIGFTALDHDVRQVEIVRKFGHKIYFGDATRKDLLETAGITQAKFLLNCLDDVDSSVALTRTVREEFPNVKIWARARNRDHAMKLLELGANHVFRETLHSSAFATGDLLKEFGMTQQQADEFLSSFLRYDEKLLKEQFDRRHDQEELVSFTIQYNKNLEAVLRADESL